MKVLFICFKKYNTILEGGGIANQRNIDMTKKIVGEPNVDISYIHDESKKRSLWNKIISLFWMIFGYYNGLSPRKVRNICETANNYDCVFLSSSLFGKIAQTLNKKQYKGKIITHFHNIESKYYADLLSKSNPLRPLFICCSEKNDHYSCIFSNKIIALNSRDSNMLQNLYNRKADIIIPIAMKDNVDDKTIDKTIYTSSKPICTFIGSNFKANSDGILWFVKNVLPYVDVEFKVVGKGMLDLKNKYKELSNIEVISDVPDLAKYYHEADFMILPIFSGSGMKVKTCECLMYGKNIIGTDETFEGYDLDTEKVGARCNTPEEYINKLNNFISKPVPKFNPYSRNIFLKKYSDEAIINYYKSILY